MHPKFGRVAFNGLLWSIAKNWGGRILALAVFTILARFLNPKEFGTAAAASLILMFVGMIAEFGFGDAIVQAPSLALEDVNLPFYVAMSISVVLSILVVFFASALERWFGVQGARTLIMAMCGMAPIITAAMFQEAMYRRALEFRKLAIRVFVANLVAGPIAIVCAWFGMGVWTLVVHAYLSAVIGILWLWHGALWTPGKVIHFKTFRSFGKFGFSITVVRLVEFISVRFLDVAIISKFGLAALGLYTIGSRVQKSLMQILLSSINEVALPILSKISDDLVRMREIYVQVTAFAAYLAMPLFFLAAALAHGIFTLLFGAKWTGVAEVAQPLLMLGGLQCVQFLNSPYLTARGRPDLVRHIAVIRAVAVTLSLVLIPFRTVPGLVVTFVVLQVLFSPINFYLATRELGISLVGTFTKLFPAFFACLLAYSSAALARPRIDHIGLSAILVEPILGLVFLICYLACIRLTGWEQLMASISFLLARFRGR